MFVILSYMRCICYFEASEEQFYQLFPFLNVLYCYFHVQLLDKRTRCMCHLISWLIGSMSSSNMENLLQGQENGQFLV